MDRLERMNRSTKNEFDRTVLRAGQPTVEMNMRTGVFVILARLAVVEREREIETVCNYHRLKISTIQSFSKSLSYRVSHNPCTYMVCNNAVSRSAVIAYMIQGMYMRLSVGLVIGNMLYIFSF